MFTLSSISTERDEEVLSQPLLLETPFQSEIPKEALPAFLQPLPEEAILENGETDFLPPVWTGYTLGKRIGDLLTATLLLVILAPIFALIAAAIVLDSGVPVLYYQMRTGYRGRAFRFYKFRSMVTDADVLKQGIVSENEATGPIFKMRNDPRITRVGRWLRRYSVDELPQLINVVRGEMSLVGPRPLPVAEAALCTLRQQNRHRVPPGLLCFREIGGRSHLTFEHWMELDLIYLQHRSFCTDFFILSRAVGAVLRADGAY